MPDIDLFASRINKQLDCYASWRPDPNALFVDAFSEPWTRFYGYIFPPFSVIGRVLRKIQVDKAEAIIVFPQWPGQIWYPKLQKMCVGPVLQSPGTALELPQDSTRTHPLMSKLHLLASCCPGKDI